MRVSCMVCGKKFDAIASERALGVCEPCAPKSPFVFPRWPDGHPLTYDGHPLDPLRPQFGDPVRDAPMAFIDKKDE